MKEVLDPTTAAKTMITCVERIMQDIGQLDFSQEPDFKECTLIDYKGKMRSLSLDKFNGPCYTSYITYYETQQAQEKKQTQGTVVVYVEENCAERLLKRMGYDCNADETEIMLDSAGEFCNLIAGQYKNSLSQMGYIDMYLSTPTTTMNDFVDGIPFHLSQYVYHEISFYLWKQKSFVVSVTLGPIAAKL